MAESVPGKWFDIDSRMLNDFGDQVTLRRINSVKRYLPNPVNELMKDAVSGRASRRDILKRGAALGLSATMMGTILAAEKATAQDASPAAEQPAGWAITVPADLPDLAGTTIAVMLSDDGVGAPFDQAMCDKFAEATGATVNFIKGATSATERLTFLQQTMAAQSSDIDVAQIDVIWPGIFAAHAVDLTDQVGDVEFFERIQANNTVDGKLVGLPWFTDAGLLYYRTDLLEKYGFEGPPMTWQELTDMATTIQEGEAAANSAFTGFTFQGNAYEGLTCNALEWQFSNGGGSIIEPDGTVSVNNEQAIAALRSCQESGSAPFHRKRSPATTKRIPAVSGRVETQRSCATGRMPTA